MNKWLEENFQLAAPDLPDLRHYEGKPEEAALALRSYWGLGDKPIKHMVALLESKGVRIYSLAEKTREVDAYSFWKGGRPFVFMNTFKSSEHSRFDAAHELAHLVLHDHGTPQGREQEREAQQFASAFLMPASSVLARTPRMITLQRLIEAKHFWNVSLSALAYRLHYLKRLSDWQYRSMCIAIQNAGFRTSEPESAPREKSKVWEKIFDSLRAEGTSQRQLAKQLCWPVDELNDLVFGLALIVEDGGGEAEAAPAPRGHLKLVK